MYAPCHAPSLLSVPPHSSILHPAVLKSFKLALLKGKRSIPATLSTQQKGAGTEGSSLPSASSAWLDESPSSPPRLSVSNSLPLPLLARQPTESAHVLQPQLKRSFSFTHISSSHSLSSSHSKRHRGDAGAASPFALAPPSADVTGDAELAAFYIARELVEFSSRFIIVPGEGEEDGEEAGQAAQSAAAKDAVMASSDMEESEEEGGGGQRGGVGGAEQLLGVSAGVRPRGSAAAALDVCQSAEGGGGQAAAGGGRSGSPQLSRRYPSASVLAAGRSS